MSTAPFDKLLEKRCQNALAERCAAGLAPAGPAASVQVLVPIHDAIDAVRACVAALIRHTPAHHRLLLIDDASRDPAITEFLASLLGTHPGLQVRCQPRNLGYLATVNAALASSTGDVILLNSDALVGEGWIDGLARAAHSENRVGIACPLSDQATLLTVLPPDLAASVADDELQRISRTCAERRLIRLPVAVGFCMYLRAELVAMLGGFDEAFAPGYGEENEYSLRAWAAGFQVVAASDVFVRHLGSASFGHGPERQRRQAVHARLVDARWPQHQRWIRTWWRDWPLRRQAEAMRVDAAAASAPRVLQLAHRLRSLGGTELHVRQLAAHLRPQFESLLVASEVQPMSDADALETFDAEGTPARLRNADTLLPRLLVDRLPSDLSDPAAERFYLRMLDGFQPDLVHIHCSVGWNTLALPMLTRKLGIPLVLTLHNLEALCPDHMLAPPPQRSACGRPIAGSDPSCIACLQQRGTGPQALERSGLELYLAGRRAFWRQALMAADAVVAPSHFVARRVLDGLERDIGERLHVIGHGIDLGQPQRRGPRGKPLRVGFLGGTARAKGYQLLVDLVRRTKHAPIQFHIYGVFDPSELGDIGSAVVIHPHFQRQQLHGILARLDLLLMPSVVEESYGLTLSEARRAGVPVLASQLGALSERIDDAQTGWLLPAGNAHAWAQRLLQLADPASGPILDRVSAAARQLDPTWESVAQTYRELYAGLRRACAQHPAPSSPGPDPASKWLLREAASLLRAESSAWLPPLLPAALRRSLLPARLHVLVRVQQHNQHRLEDTLASLRGIAADHQILAIDVELECNCLAVDQPEQAIHIKVPDRSEWCLCIEAGDLLHPELALWLSAQAAALRAIWLGWDLICAEARHYAPSTLPPAASPSTNAPAHGLALRAGILRQSGGWRGPARDPAWPLSLDPQCSRSQALPWSLLHRWDGNLSAWTRDGWLNPYLPATPVQTTTPIRIEFLQSEESGNPGNAVQALAELQELASGLDVDMAPGAEYLLALKPGTRPASAEQLSQLVALARETGAAMLAPTRHYKTGELQPALIHFDGSTLLPAPDPLATHPEPTAGLLHAEGLAADALLIRADLVDARTRHLLRRADATEIHAWQRQLRAEGHLLLWAANIEFRQDRPSLPTPLDEQARNALLEQHLREPLPGLAARSRAPRGAIAMPRRWRVAALTRDRWASSHYRVIDPLRWLADNGDIDPAALWCTELEAPPALPEFVEAGADCVLFHHPFDDASLQLMADCARHLSCPRVLIIDDLITELPGYSSARKRLPDDIGERVAEALSRATSLVVTSPGLQRAYGTGIPTTVIENALAEQPWLELQRPTSSTSALPLRVGWAGAMQHAGDLALIEHLLDHADPRVQWVFLGTAPQGAAALGAEVHPMVAFDRYPQRLAELNLDLALIPLADNPFNRCKSALKLIELGSLGIPVIASDLDPYQEAPVPRVGADPRAWREALERLIHEHEERLALGKRLREWVCSRHLLSHRRLAWRQALGMPA